MLFRWVIVFASVVVACARDQGSTNGSLSLEALRSKLAAHISREQFRGAQWGIKIATVDSGAVIFETNSVTLLKPASNAKLFTGALALDGLGSDYKIRTSIYSAAAAENGILKGDLVIYGRGDPSFSSAFSGDSSNALSKVVEAIQRAGIQHIQGDLVGDATFFAGAPYGASWTWDDLQYYYGAEASALSAQENTIDLVIRAGDSPGAPCRIEAKPNVGFVELVNRTRTGAANSKSIITIDRPVGLNRAYVNGSLAKGSAAWNDGVSISNAPLLFLTLLKEELGRAGIVIEGKLRAIGWPEESVVKERKLMEIGTVQSADVSTIVHKMMKASNNLYAQLLLLQVGSQNLDGAQGTTEERGIQRLSEFAKRAGIRGEEVRLEDGAGLSRSGLVTPNAIVQLLRYMARDKSAETFRASLPEAGVDGTLRTRLKDLQGKLQAKTGTIRYVNTLSGYLKTGSGQELVFSIMLNAYAPATGGSARDEVDAIPRLAARLQERIP